LTIRSFVTIELDTTSPSVSLFISDEISIGYEEDIIVLSNEQLDVWSEAYFIDSVGVRHDISLTYEGNGFIGTYNFNACSMGVGTIYVRVRDTVFNLSDIKTQTINLMTILDKSLNIELFESCVDIITEDFIMEQESYEITSNIALSETIAQLELIENCFDITIYEQYMK